MRLRAHRRNLVLWSQSASSIGRDGALPFTRTRRIRRWIRVGALLTVVSLMPLARAGRSRWRLLLAGGLLTVAGVMLHGGLGGVILLLLVSASFVPARPKTDRMRRAELEMDLHYHRIPGAGRY